VEIVGVSIDTLESHRMWIERLKIPFLLLSDPERKAGKALDLMRKIKVGTWGVEFFRRSTLLVDKQGIITAAWGKVQIRGHAQQVLQTARVLQGLD
jgi:peroxiredoxin Q/BCP